MLLDIGLSHAACKALLAAGAGAGRVPGDMRGAGAEGGGGR
jgi:hypothetical protein